MIAIQAEPGLAGSMIYKTAYMLHSDINIVKEKYPGDWKTRSINPQVLKLYAHIVGNLHVDSDVWTAGGGLDDIVYMLKPFDDDDWVALAADLPNWTTDQLNIFTEGILTGDEFLDNPDEQDIRCINKRAGLLPLLLTINNERGDLYLDITSLVNEHIGFLFKVDPLPLQVFLALKEWSSKGQWRNAAGENTPNPNSAIIEEAIKKASGNNR